MAKTRGRAKKKPTRRGGARNGAGRKPATTGGSVTVAVSMTRALHERLLRRVLETEQSVSAVVQQALERELG